MIALRCSNCGKVQELEDPFAGCVCRCRFCRAIQTVPEDTPQATASLQAPHGGSGPVLLHCPELARPAVKQHRAAPQDPADRRLIFAVGLAAMLALVAAGGAIALLRSLEAEDAGKPSIAGSAELVDGPLDP